jgi:glycosyltransferase A (GT-A) superfamily protein (DUF2064 family)
VNFSGPEFARTRLTEAIVDRKAAAVEGDLAVNALNELKNAEKLPEKDSKLQQTS